MITNAASNLRDSAGVPVWRRANPLSYEVRPLLAASHSWGCTCSSCVRQELFLAGLRATSPNDDTLVAIRGNAHSPD